MNDRPDPPSELDARLHRLLDQAARSFEPTEDSQRLALLLGGRGRRRHRVMVPLAAAAALVLMVGTVSALVGSEDSAPRIAPAEAPSTTAAPATTTLATTSSSTSTTTTSSSTSTTTTTTPPTTELPLLAPPPPPPPPTTAKPTPPPDTTPKQTQPPDTKPPAPSIAFTAVQHWGSGAGDPPFDEFSGTAPPGEKVLVHWHTGSQHTYADGAGSWYLKVFFSQVAVGQTIEVKVKAVGEVKYFTFTRTA